MFKKFKNLKKISKNIKKSLFFAKKNAILLVFQYYEDGIRPELSSPPRFRFQGGSPERTDEGRRKEILVSEIFQHFFRFSYQKALSQKISKISKSAKFQKSPKNPKEKKKNPEKIQPKKSKINK